MKTIHNAGKLALAAVMLVSANAYASQADSKAVAEKAACVSACPKGSKYHSPFLVSGEQQDRFGIFVGDLTQTAMLAGAGYVTGKAAEKCFVQGLNGWNQSTGAGAYIAPIVPWILGLGTAAAGFAVAGVNIATQRALNRSELQNFGIVTLAAIATFINEFSKESAAVQADLVAMENGLNTPATSSTDASSTDASKRNAAAKMSMPAKK